MEPISIITALDMIQQADVVKIDGIMVDVELDEDLVGDPENEIARFSWEGEGDEEGLDYEISLLEGENDGTMRLNGNTIHAFDSNGEPVQIKLFNLTPA